VSPLMYVRWRGTAPMRAGAAAAAAHSAAKRTAIHKEHSAEPERRSGYRSSFVSNFWMRSTLVNHSGRHSEILNWHLTRCGD
jgi:hypothetical protein